MAFIAPVLPALGAIGAVAGAAGTLYQGVATSEAASYQAQVEKNNAAIAKQNAARATAAGQTQAADVSMKGAAQIGAIKVAQAANGVDVNSGSALNVQGGQRESNELDSERALNNAQLEAYGYQVAATSDTAQAGLDEATAENAPIGSGLSAAGGLLGSDKFTGFISGSPKIGGT